MECACEQTESLRGAAVNAYLTRFLERVDDAADPIRGTYQCRVCGTRWLRQAKDAKEHAQLVRLAKDAFFQENEE
jgi:hypothetical protein